MAGEGTKVYMIGNAHIDPVWMWRWQEGLTEVLATCRSALDRMNEYPEFVFTRADAATYKWIEETSPEMFEEIRHRVREGRWNLVGGWWEQPDCNIPSGESFVRHELYGKRYFLDRFGVDVKVGYNVDSFGHNAGLPQILAKAGIEYYVFMRPGVREMELPDSMFCWEGPSGARVLTFRLTEPYCTNDLELPGQVDLCVDNRPQGINAAACFFGVGNHGGGPTIANIQCIRRLQDDPESPDVVFGTLQEMFEQAKSEKTDFPVVKGDLQHHAVGCYTAHAGIKQWNRRVENTLVSAEKFSALAKLACGRAFPKEKFAEAWQKVLFNQFHDILAGTSLAEAYEDVRNSMGAAIDFGEHETATSLMSIASRVDTSGEGTCYVVFNSHPHAVRCPVRYNCNQTALRDHTGRSLPVQETVPVLERTGYRAERLFVDELPALGYRVYYAGDWEDAKPEAVLTASETTIKNGRFTMEIDPGTGLISQIRDERTGQDLLASPAGPIVIEDNSDTWSHDVVRFDGPTERFGDTKIEVVENGPVRATVRIESRLGQSTLWQDISLYADLDIIESRVTVDWREKHRMLKFEFPFDLESPAATYDAAYGVVTAPTDGAENPGQKWIDVTGQTYGVSLINDSKYGFDVLGGTMRLSALRSPIYAFHDPRKVEPGVNYHYMDQGLHSFTFALVPHEVPWQDAGAVREALILNMPPVAVETHHHAGELPAEHSFVSVSEPNIDLCAMKECEDDASLIVRLYETSGKATNARITVGREGYPLEMGAFELKTLKIGDGTAVEVDLLERDRVQVSGAGGQVIGGGYSTVP